MRNLPVISAFERIKIALRGVLKHIRPFSRIKYLFQFNTQLLLFLPPRKRPGHVDLSLVHCGTEGTGGDALAGVNAAQGS